MILLRPWLMPPLSPEDREVDEIGRMLWAQRRAARPRIASRHKQRGFILNPFAFGAAAPTDPSWANVSLLMPLNGANGGTTFTDVSSFASNHTISLFAGNAVTTTSTAQSQWGGSSYLCTGTSGGVSILTAGGTEFTYAGDASFDIWTRWTNSNSQYVFDHGTNGTTFIIVPSSGNVQFYQGGHIINTGSTPFSTGTWYFLQLVRSGTTWTVGRNGSSYATGTSGATLGFTGIGTLKLGQYGGGNIATVGHFQDFRVTNGVARPLAVPTAAFPTS